MKGEHPFIEARIAHLTDFQPYKDKALDEPPLQLRLPVIPLHVHDQPTTKSIISVSRL
jgi:hypothetical protein